MCRYREAGITDGGASAVCLEGGGDVRLNRNVHNSPNADGHAFEVTEAACGHTLTISKQWEHNLLTNNWSVEHHEEKECQKILKAVSGDEGPALTGASCAARGGQVHREWEQSAGSGQQ